MIKRMFLFFSTMAFIMLLVACGEDTVDGVDTPRFSHLEVNNTDPGTPDDFNVFFVEKNELITIDIYLDNPSNLPINLISINGTPYRQARFEDNSTSSHIILRLDVLRVPGQTQYEINEIEYTHPEDGVQSVGVHQDNIFQVYVLESSPTGEFNQITTNQTSLSANLNLRDPDQTIVSAELVLLLNDSEIEKKSLSIGLHTYQFTDLYSDTAYDVQVVVTYERAAGELVQESMVLNEALDVKTNHKTAPSVEMRDVAQTERTITFDLDAVDPDQTGRFTDIALYQNDQRIHTFADGEAFEATDLFSDTTYDIYAEYTYDLNDTTGPQTIILTQTITTDTLTAPTLDIENLSPTEEAVLFDLYFEDLDQTLMGDTLTIELWKDDVLINTQTTSLDALESLSFDGLLSDSDYTIIVKATFDLNDQHGTQEGTLSSHLFTTEPVTLPEVDVQTQTVDESRLIFRINTEAIQALLTDDVLHIHFYDTDTGVLLKSAQLIQDTLTLEVKDMLANQSVRLEIIGTYDLNDGLGDRTGVMYANTYQTTANAIPTGQINAVNFDQSSITFSYTLNDPDNTLVPDRFIAIIYEDNGQTLEIIGTLILDPSVSEHTFDYTPKAAYSYGVQLFVDYDLRDGQGITEEHSLNALYVVTDLHAKAPSATLELSDIQDTSVIAHYEVLDIDDTITAMTLSINGETVSVSDLEDTYLFDGLTEATSYTITFTITYEQKGETQTLVVEETFTTSG